MADEDTGELVLRCRVGGHELAIPAAAVREVHAAVAVDPLPGAPETVLGIVDVRGDLLPVVDLRRRLGLPAPDVSPGDVLVEVDGASRPSLLLVDHVRSVERVARDRVQAAEELAAGVAVVRDVVSTPEGLLLIADVETFLSSTETVQVEDALARLSERRPRAGERR